MSVPNTARAKSPAADTAIAQETTPLLPTNQDDDKPKEPRSARSDKAALYLALLSGFLISLSFGVTQVPILYVFRIMVCDAYYKDHPIPDQPGVDRCSERKILASTARAISLLGASTTVFGLLNLLVTGWTIKRFGVKKALLIQIFWPAVRLAVQNVGVMTSGNTGIIIMQCSQILTIIGGPNGYVLTLNSFVADVSTHEQRTGALGRLMGAMMLGSAAGFLVGGILGDVFGILAPFRITLVLFLLCCVFVVLALPDIPPEQDVNAGQKVTGITRFFGPLRIFAPQKWTLRDGRTSVQFGALTLGVGVFLAILATGYIPTSLLMYSTDEFGFGTSENGWLIFIYSSLRGTFLSFVFPRIIAIGRKWVQPDRKSEPSNGTSEEPSKDAEEEEPLLPTRSNEFGPIDTMDNDAAEPPAQPLHKSDTKQPETYAFDLMYARFSLVLDGLLTSTAVFANKGWQLYLFAIVIPLAAGTGSASKGALLQMIPENEKVDALSGITLVENVARLSTTAVFGLIFAALAEVGQSHLIFIVNAGVALLGFVVLCFSRFPPEGSRRFNA